MGKEYIVWGVPAGEQDECILYTKARSHAQAKQVVEVLGSRKGCTNMRIQVIDMATDDLAERFTLSK